MNVRDDPLFEMTKNYLDVLHQSEDDGYSLSSTDKFLLIYVSRDPHHAAPSAQRSLHPTDGGHEKHIKHDLRYLNHTIHISRRIMRGVKIPVRSLNIQSEDDMEPTLTEILSERALGGLIIIFKNASSKSIKDLMSSISREELDRIPKVSSCIAFI